MLVLVLLLVTAAIGVAFGRRHKWQRKYVQQELAVTAETLTTTRDENERFAEALDLLDHGSRIDESDLSFGEIIGAGASGRVFSGSWGYETFHFDPDLSDGPLIYCVRRHISVAIKVLIEPIDNLSPQVLDDFNREVSGRRS